MTPTGRTPVDDIAVAAYQIPTDFPEADGTLEWDSTTIVVVHAAGGGETGLGLTYADAAAARLIRARLAPAVLGVAALAVPAAWQTMVRSVRNLGRPGIGAMAIAAVDVALWDLKAKLLDLPLVDLLGPVREAVPAYGSGGFTSDPVPRLREQLAGWVAGGLTCVKMKVGADPAHDVERVLAAREAIGPDAGLFVDANGAYARKQALVLAGAFAELGVTWFEEPVSSDDLDGLRLLRDRSPAGMEIAAGEYGYDLHDFRRMLDAGAVDVLQADATRCAGITGFLRAATLCAARSMPLSAHTAPSLHAHPCCALEPVRHVEYFHDHARIERMLFDGALTPEDGMLRPARERPGHGLELRPRHARRWEVRA